MMLAPLVFEALDFLVENTATITADAHGFGWGGEDLLGATARDGDAVELGEHRIGEECRAGRILDVCLEDQVATIGREGLRYFLPRVRRQLTCLAPTSRHQVDVGARGIAVGGEGYVLAIGRPYREALVGFGGGETTCLATGAGDGVDIALVSEGDGLAIGRNRWIAQPEWALLCYGR